MSSYPNDPYPNSEQPVSSSSQPVRIALPGGKSIVTYVILGITIFVYLLQMGSQLILKSDLPVLYGARINELILQGQIWRFITPILLHGSLMHIGFNMYALFIFGPGLERGYGRMRFIALYLLAGFAGNVVSFLFSEGYSIGASSSIFGLLAAEGVFLYQNRGLLGDRANRALGNIIMVAGVNLLLGLSPGIDNWGHIGGLLGGFIFAWFAGPLWKVSGIYPAMHVVDERNESGVMVGTVLVLLIFGALAVMEMFFWS